KFGLCVLRGRAARRTSRQKVRRRRLLSLTWFYLADGLEPRHWTRKPTGGGRRGGGNFPDNLDAPSLQQAKERKGWGEQDQKHFAAVQDEDANDDRAPGHQAK